MLAAAATGAALFAGYGSAAAQLVIETPPADVYVDTPYSYNSGYYTTRRGPRVYGYTREYRYRRSTMPFRFARVVPAAAAPITTGTATAASTRGAEG